MSRIYWRLYGKLGYGSEMFPTDLLLEYVKSLNKEYGEGTHWIENR